MIRAVWSSFWGELNTPSSFYADPYGALTNASGHMLLGLCLSAGLALAYCAAFGEMPFRWAVWAAVTFGYLILIEWLKQDWQKADSIKDGGFVALGAAIPLLALKEVAFHPKVVLEPKPVEGLAVLAVSVIALAAYVYPRAVRKWTSTP